MDKNGNDIDKNSIDSTPFDIDLIQMLIKKRVQTSKVDFSKENGKDRLKVVNTVFKIFIGIYGRQFADQYDNDFAKDIWFNALLVFDKEQIAEGIELVLQDEYVTAPNLKRFMVYCAQGKKQQKAKSNKLPRLVKGKNNY